ncbi:developmental regulatory protein wetA-like [Mustela putorius furo]|uniref:Developmental regulatory protein wetA-like n=1 Tax=Mustela putorius furo TaxID=9669 RepID=A0A8U0N9I9_MUSPF|nr:developmental regulatory protein wetA-like [Mustela putorius furo]
MKKESGGRITSLTLEKKGGWERGREREGVARRCDGKRCGSGSGGIRRADGGGPANWKAAESRVSQRRAVAAAPLLIAPGAAAGGGWIQRPWRRLWRRQLPSDPRQRILDCSPYAGDMGTRQPLPSPGAPSPSAAPARPPSRPSPLLGARSGSLRALPPARSPVSGCGAGSSSLPSFLPLSLGPGGGGGGVGGGGSTSLHSPGSGAALCEERRLRSRLALPHSPSPLLLVLRLLPPPPSLTPPSAPPPA